MSRNDVQKMLPRHFEIMKLTLAGYGRKEIADALGVTPGMVGMVTQSPLFQDELSRRRATQQKLSDERQAISAMQVLERAATEAAEKQVEIMRGDNHRLALQGAGAILDRVLSNQATSKGHGVTLNEKTLNLMVTVVNEIKATGVVPTLSKVERDDIEIVES